MRRSIKRKAQSGVFFIFVAMFIILSVIALFFTYSGKSKDVEINMKEYMHNYGSSMLLSFLRSSTGNPQPDCSKVNDLIFKLYSSPPQGKCCGIEDKTCEEYVREIMERKWNIIMKKAKKGYIYYLEINKPRSNRGILFKSGDARAKELKYVSRYVVKQEAIPSHISYVEYPYAILYIVDKREIKGE